MRNFFNKQSVLVAVYAFIVGEEDKFLIVRRADHDSMPGVWEMPGGKIEFGEEIKPALVREVKEEVGLDVEVLSPITVRADTNGQRHLIRISFKAEAKNFNVKLSEEHSDYKWVKKPEGEKISTFLEDTFKEVSLSY